MPARWASKTWLELWLGKNRVDSSFFSFGLNLSSGRANASLAAPKLA